MKNKNLVRLTQAAVIAALYAALTIGQNVLLPGTASMAVQFRVAEALTVLAVFTPVAIPGLTIGCIIANISSVIAALTMYGLRNVRIKTIPFAALLMPALWNGLIVGFEIDFFFIGNMSFNLADFLTQGGFVALGELVVLIVLGIPLIKLIEHNKNINRLLTT